MKTSLTKSMILSSSLLLAVTVLSSCGKSKEVKSQPPTAQIMKAPPAPLTQAPPVPSTLPPAQPPLTAPAPIQNTQLNPNNTVTNGNRGRLQPLPPLNSNGPETLPPIPSAPNQSLPPLTPLPPTDSSLQPINQAGSIKSLQEQISDDQTRAFQVSFKGQVAVKTGGQSNGQIFTSTGDDSLMEEFKSYTLKVPQDQQNRNMNLAKAITNAKLSRSAGEMSVTLSMDEFGVVNTYRLVASDDDNLKKLTLSKNGTTGELPYEGGFLKCLDVDGGCNTAYAKLKFGGGYTRVIFRNSNADLNFLLQEKISNNPGFSAISRYILNAANSINTSEKIEGMKLSSFEVVNGRSAVGALLTTADHQAIAMNIPMVVSGNLSDSNAPVAKVSDLSKNFDLSNAGYSSNISQNIGAIKIVNNNGRGQFKLQLQFGTDSAPASIWIVAVSMAKETMTLQQIQTFESTLKSF